MVHKPDTSRSYLEKFIENTGSTQITKLNVAVKKLINIYKYLIFIF